MPHSRNNVALRPLLIELYIGNTNIHTCGFASRPHTWINVGLSLHESWHVLPDFLCHVGLGWCVGIHLVAHTSISPHGGAGVLAFSSLPTCQFSRTQRGLCVGVYQFAHAPVSSPTPKAVSCHVFCRVHGNCPSVLVSR